MGSVWHTVYMTLINSVKTNASTMEPHGVWRTVDIPSTPGCRRGTPRTWVGQTGRWPLTMLSRVWRSGQVLGRGTDSSTCPAPLTLATNSTNRWLLLRRPRRPGPVDLAPDFVCHMITKTSRGSGMGAPAPSSVCYLSLSRAPCAALPYSLLIVDSQKRLLSLNLTYYLHWLSFFTIYLFVLDFI